MAESAPGLRVATFNAGLAVGMLPHCSERLELIVRALADLDADLLFVQEFWVDTHWQELTRAHGGRGPAGLMAYGGSFGTGLLSKTPLEDRDVLVFTSTVNARGAIHARMTTRVAKLDVFAVHFSPGPESEQRPQVDRLLRWIDERGAKGPTIVLGDLNMGPGSSSFRRFVDAGFDDPYARQSNGKCTFCGGGLTSAGHGTSGILIDHVLVRGFRGTTLSERVLDDTVTLIAGGSPVKTTLSDHCGVLVTLRG